MNFTRERGFFWDRRTSDRGVIEVNSDSLTKARKKLPSEGFNLKIDSDLDGVLENLSDPAVKPDTWVRGRVLEIYRSLAEHGFVKTYEAHRDGRLIGALIGVDLRPVFIADTMFGREGAAKACLRLMIEDLHEKGYAFVDTQIVHKPDHPVARIGEVRIALDDFRRRMRTLVSLDLRRS